MAPNAVDLAAVVEVLAEFMEAVIHQILFVRELYSVELFERQRLYGVAVRRARHPELCDYIHEVVAGLKDVLAAGTLAKVALVVQSAAGEAVERFVIEPVVVRGTDGTSGAHGTLDMEDVEAQLRGCVLKLQYVDSYLRRPPPGCTFEVVAFTAGRGGLETGAWVEEQGAAQLEVTPAAAAEVVPIKSCRVEGAFRLQLYAEGIPPECTTL